MATVKLHRSPADFWCMTFRELNSLIKEHNRQEAIMLRTSATTYAYANACYKIGKIPFDGELEPKEDKQIEERPEDILAFL